ncbi:hypothetical protein TH53_20830 [Pedobacter lusitanus]|uniref:DUF4249 domain-containing protein n=1 Tax=Pedobacter lusitanus TaxID=1503925 RepID=A0A0D0GH44_9SPHI|nr:DUF4249 domain-containing protein [Pedobacter lusitanus]KIO75420.1 hypothetical protein TH53_20830 [Pedobacter lusitanus]
MKALNLVPVLAVLLFTSCEKKLTINLPADMDRPVLNVLMNENSPLKVRLSLSGRLSSGQSFKEVDYAETTLYENDTFKELLKPKIIDGKTYYVSNSLVLKDKRYKVTTALPGFKLIEGSDVIPDITKIEINNQTVTESSSDSYKLKFNFLLKNLSKEKQYYRFRVLYEDKEKTGTVIKTPFFIRPVNTTDLFGSGNSEKRAWFAEKAQPAGETIFYSFTADFNPGPKKMYIEVTLLTETSYKYLKSVSKADDSEDSPFSEKVIIHSNVQNGLGIVGGLSYKEFLIPAK